MRAKWALFVALTLYVFPTAGFAQAILTFQPITAKYSQSLDRIIMISTSPNQVHIFDPSSGNDVTIALANTPLSLSISPDGNFAAVGHSTQVSYVNLQAQSVQKIFNVPMSGQSLALTSAWIYLLPTYEGTIASVNIATGAVTNAPSSFYYASGAAYNPQLNALYGTQDGGSPNDIVEYNIASGPITTQSMFTANWGDFSICGPLVFSPDGARIYDACGTVFHASSDPTQDRQYLTTFAGATSARSLAASADQTRVALVQNATTNNLNPVDDTIVLLYEAAHLNPIGQFALSAFQAGTRSYKAHGQWVFFNAASTTLYVIDVADQSSGLLNDFAVQTFQLATGGGCSATFSTASVSAVAAGETDALNFTAGTSCVYGAVSSVPWIQVLSGGYGSGNGTLGYIVRPNAGPARSGTITIGSATFTVNQAAASTSTPLTRLPYNVVSAAYDKPMDALILISGAPNELHIYNPKNNSGIDIPLSKPPLSLSVSRDGNSAAVGYDGWVANVDLQAQKVVQENPVETDVSGVLQGGNGFVYLFSRHISSSMFSMSLATGAVTAINAFEIGTIARLSADGQAMYIGGSELSHWTINGGTPTVIDDPFNVSACGNFWPTDDGLRLFTSCGTVYRTSNIVSQDLQSNGSLAPLTSVIWSDHSSGKQEVAVAPGSLNTVQPQVASAIQMYGDAYLGFLGFVPIPQFSVNGSTYGGSADFVFWTQDSSSLVVVEQAAAASGLSSSFGVAVVSPVVSNLYPFSASKSGAFSITSAGTASATTVGSAQLTAGFGSSLPSALAIFGQRQNGVLVSEATVPGVVPAQSGEIYAEVGGAIDTGIAISNPNASSATLSFYFRDNTGTMFGAGTTTIPPNGQIAAFLDQAPFNSGKSFVGTFAFSSTVPTAAIALRLLTNERGESIWTTLPILSSQTFSNQFASFADGGGWSTEFILVNQSGSPIQGTLNFYPSTKLNGGPISGSSVAVTINGQTGNAFNYSIPANGTQTFTTSGTGTSTSVGWVAVVANGGSVANGMAILSEKNSSGVTISQAGVPASAESTAFGMYAEVSNDASQIQSGVAIANPTNSAVKVNLALTDLNGNSVGSATVSIPANGQSQMFLNQIPGLQNIPAPLQGVLSISTTSGGVIVLGLRSRYNERGEFLITTVTPVPQNYGSASPQLVFPQIADGGGFTTEFILYNPPSIYGSTATAGGLQFYNQAGQTISLIFP